MSSTLANRGAERSAVDGADATDGPPRQRLRELWLITGGHALTHWYPATFYLLLPIIGNELGCRSARSASS